MKSTIAKKYTNDTLTEVYRCSLIEPSELEYWENLAKTNSQALLEAEKAEIEAKEKEEAEKREKAYLEAYYATWRVVFTCDSLLNDWQLGDETIDETIVSKCKAEALKGESVEKLLANYDKVKTYFVKIFGEVSK